MPVLSFDDTPKRFIIPSTQELNEQAWVEMPTYPLCADDFSADYYMAVSEYHKQVANGAAGAKEPMINHYVLARRITDWNYTDAQGNKLVIDVSALKHLKLPDITFLMDRIEKAETEALDDPKDVSSSTTSSQPAVASE